MVDKVKSDFAEITQETKIEDSEINWGIKCSSWTVKAGRKSFQF